MRSITITIMVSAMLVPLVLSGCASDRKTTGFWQEMREPVAVNTGKQRSGEQVYEYRCQGCHGKNTQGAPMPGDQEEWGRRLQQGMGVLMAHTINGYKQTMPPRGGCLNCSDLELRRALVYMLSQSEIRWSGDTTTP